MNLEKLNQSMFQKIQQAEQADRKNSRQTPNVANLVGDHVAFTWLELGAIADLWVTGSHVWTWLYREEPPAGADVDMFCTTADAYVLATSFLESIAIPPADGDNRPQPVKSRSGDERGTRIHTARGWVDIWYAKRDPIAMINSYPSDGYAHCRAAYSPASRALIISPNEASEDPDLGRTSSARRWIATPTANATRAPQQRNAPKFGRLRRAWRWLVAKLTPGRPVDRLIGRADRLLSEYLVLAEDPRLDAADRQTLKHHADDFIGVGQAALRKLKP